MFGAQEINSISNVENKPPKHTQELTKAANHICNFPNSKNLEKCNLIKKLINPINHLNN